MLSKFQNDLGSISSEIQILQDQSHSMSIKLKNRQVYVREEGVVCVLGACCTLYLRFLLHPLPPLLPSLLFSPLSSSPPFYILGSKRGAQPVCLRDNSHRAPHSVSYTHLLIQLYTKHYRSSFLPTVLLSSPLLSSSPPPPPTFLLSSLKAHHRHTC